MLFPAHGGTQLLLDARVGNGLPTARWLGRVDDAVPRSTDGDDALLAAAGAHRGVPLLPEQSRGRLTRPGLRGHRIDAATGSAGQHWSTAFTTSAIDASERELTIEAVDKTARLELRTEI